MASDEGQHQEKSSKSICKFWVSASPGLLNKQQFLLAVCEPVYSGAHEPAQTLDRHAVWGPFLGHWKPSPGAVVKAQTVSSSICSVIFWFLTSHIFVLCLTSRQVAPWWLLQSQGSFRSVFNPSSLRRFSDSRIFSCILKRLPEFPLTLPLLHISSCP